MKAICSSKIGIDKVELKDIERPIIKPDHVLVKVSAGAVNHGDLHWLEGEIPRGLYPESLHGVAGASSAGEVIEIGENVPDDFKGSKVAYYRSLHPSEFTVGCWCEFALLHYLDCVILPKDANTFEYCGSVVNIVNAYAFIEHAKLNPERGVIATAGESLTGRALIGIAHEKNIPVISIVRNESEKQRLEVLGADNILVQNDSAFNEQVESLSQELHTTAVFDGVGGSLITRIIPLLPYGSTIFSYGFLASYSGEAVTNFETITLFVRDQTLTSYRVMGNETVRNKEKLKIALNDIKNFVHLPHFKVETGQIFSPEEYKEAIEYTSDVKNKGKAVIKF